MRCSVDVAVVGSGVAGLTAAYVASRGGVGHPLRGRRPPRRPRRHAPGGRTWRSTPASSCTTSGPTRPCCGCSASSASPPRTPRCRCRCATTRPGSSTPARSASAGCSPAPATPPTRRTCGCSPRCRASIARRPALLTRRLHARRLPRSARFSAYFRRHFMEPLVAAVWSCDPDVALDYPARYLFTFLDHHGMLGVIGSPQWRTVTGGSHEYVRRVAAALHEVRTGTKVTSVLETRRGRGHRRQRPGLDVRRRRDRDPPRSRPRDAGGADAGPARRARRDALLPQRRAAAHRHLAAADVAAAPGRRGTSGAPSRTSATSSSPTT